MLLTVGLMVNYYSSLPCALITVLVISTVTGMSERLNDTTSELLKFLKENKEPEQQARIQQINSKRNQSTLTLSQFSTQTLSQYRNQVEAICPSGINLFNLAQTRI